MDCKLCKYGKKSAKNNAVCDTCKNCDKWECKTLTPNQVSQINKLQRSKF